MKNLKKMLSVILVFALVFSMGIGAFAFEDVKDGTKVSEAVGILSNLGIIEGFEDGTFRPEDTVTRAQMAAIICRTLGYEEQAEGSVGSTAFVDVPSSHWSSGYINIAQSLGIINGYGYGYFGPEDKVTYEQAVKMLVVALGYELDAQAKGGWPTGYMAVASREGITKSSNGSVGAPAVRGTIAVLVYNSLEVRLMDQQTWTTNGGDEYGKTDETILSQYLDVQKWEGVVTSVPYCDYAQNGYEEDADALMTLSDAFYTEYSGGRLTKNYDTIEAVDCSLVQDVNTLIGKKVVAYIGIDEDDRTGNRMVYAISEKQGANKSTKISASQLVEFGDRYYSETDVIGYRNVGSSRINTLDLDDSVEVIVNYGAGSSVTITNTSDLETLFFGAGGTIELISNDSNSKIDYILATVYDEEAVIEEVDVEDEMITFDTYTGTLEDIDTEDEDTLVVVIRDGKIASVEDIEENDTVSVVGSGDFAEGFRVLCVSSKVVTGRVESYYDNIAIINDDEYDVSPFMGASASDLSGDEGLFFLNVDGQIAWSEAEKTTRGNYGVVIATGTTSGLGAGYEIEVVLADGTVAQYPLNGKVYIEDVNGVKSDKSDSLTYQALKANMVSDGANAYRVKAEDLDDYVYEVSVKNGKVTKLLEVKRGSSTSGKDYDEENMSYGSICFDEATVVFSIEVSGSTKVEGDDVTVGTTTDFFVDGEGDNYSLIAFDENNNDIAGLVIGFGLTSTVPQDGDAFIITSVKYSEYNDYDAYVVTGLQGGKKVSYTICDEDEGYTGNESDLKKGNVILLGVKNSNGIISDFESLYSVEDGIKASDNASDDIYYIAGNLDEDIKPTDNKFFLIGNVNLEGSYYNPDDGISMKNSANYTLVDYTESRTNPEVSKKSKSKSIFGTLTKYDSIVFVRYYDDTLTEVVVYRYNQGDIVVPSPSPAPAPTPNPPAGGGSQLQVTPPVLMTPAPVETPVEEEPVVEEPKEEEKTPAVEEPKEEEKTPAVEEPKEEEKTPVAEQPKLELPKEIKPLKIPNAIKVEAAAALKEKAAKIEKAPAAVVESAPLLVKTDINSATYGELIKLEGITDAIATKIIEYRAKNGSFKTLEELKNVEGITEVIFEKIKTQITVK